MSAWHRTEHGKEFNRSLNLTVNLFLAQVLRWPEDEQRHISQHSSQTDSSHRESSTVTHADAPHSR